MGPEEASARIDALTPHLATEFPPRVFCRASLTHTAKLCRFFPNFAELCEHLSSWQRSQNPYPIWGSEAELLAMIPPEHRIERDPEKRGAQNDAQRDAATELVRNVSAQLAAIGEAKQDAIRAQLPPRPQVMPLNRAQLVEAYRRAGVKGPQTPEPQAEVLPLRSAAALVRAAVRRGPVIDAEPHDA
jgi:hypothetical protein